MQRSVRGAAAHTPSIPNGDGTHEAAPGILLYRRITYRLDDGTVVALEIVPKIADVLAQLERTEARRARERRRHERCCSEIPVVADGRRGSLDLRPFSEDTARRHVGMRTGGHAPGPVPRLGRWEGPRAPAFGILLGHGRTDWRPELEGVAPCPICKGRRLGPSWCCLGCARTGIDAVIPKPSREERAAYERARAAATGGPATNGRQTALQGGRGPAPPRRRGGAPPQNTQRG